LSSWALKVIKTAEGYMATNSLVSNYIQNKTRITSQKEYLEYMQNPLISQYEKLSSSSYYLSFAVAALVIICVLYMIRIRRFTDGEREKK